MLDKLAVDMTYLTVDTSVKERQKLINKDEQTLEKARLIDACINEVIHEIEYLYSACQLDPNKIAEFYLLHVTKELHENGTYISELADMIDYVRRVIALNNKSELN